MFCNYKIDNNTLYLYVDDKCEIGSLFNTDKNDSIALKIRDFIKKHKIKFNGTKVVLLLSGLMLGTVYLNNDVNVNYDVYKDNKYVYNIVDKSIPDIPISKQIDEIVEEAASNVSSNSNTLATEIVKSKETKQNYSTETKNKTTTNTSSSSLATHTNTENSASSSNNITNKSSSTNASNYASGKTITLYRTSGEVVQINLEEYLVGVVAAEMPASFNVEALKAQAIVARTYTLKLLETGRIITDSVSTQVYKNNSELQSMWGNSYNTYYQKVKNAVELTTGLCIKYNGSLIDAVYHSTSNGYTQDSVNVWGNSIPYLKTVTSPWDTSASSYLRSATVSFDKISSALGINFDSSSIIEIISKDESGRISKIKFNDNEITGVEARNSLGLRSADFDYSITNDGVIFTTRGYGHGVGMSQYGANGMASSGYSYDGILKHYYSGIQIVKNY